MSSNVYRNLTQLLTKWPLDSTKQGRDLGEFIRKKISKGFPLGESTQVTNIEEWTKFTTHLENIANNKALKTYPRSLESTATGLDVEECRGIISTDFLKHLAEEENSGIFKSAKRSGKDQ